jgi:hypothetical protein
MIYRPNPIGNRAYGPERFAPRAQPYRQPQLPLRYPDRPHRPAVMPIDQFRPPPGAMPRPYAVAPRPSLAPGFAAYQPTLPGMPPPSDPPYPVPPVPGSYPGLNPFGAPHMHTNVPPGHYAVPVPYPVQMPYPQMAWPQPTAMPETSTPNVPFGTGGVTAGNALNKLSSASPELQELVGNTQRHKEDLISNYSVSWVERLFKGTKEFVWDDFNKHPAMSAGAVILSTILWKTLWGTPAGKGIAWGAGLSVAYHFLRDKFGIRPVEKIAQTAGLFHPGAEKGVRSFFETLRRPFVGPEGAGSALGYFMDKLGITQGTDESVMLLGICSTSSKDFFAFYDGARNGTMSDRNMPASMKKVFNQMDTSTYFEGLSDSGSGKTRLFMQIAKKIFALAGSGNVAQGEQDLRGRILTGDFAQKTMHPLEVNIQEKIQRLPSHSPQRLQLHQLLVNVQGTISGTQEMIKRGSSEITMLDALIMEEDDLMALCNYDGIGISFKEGTKAIYNGAGQVINAVDYYGHKALDNIGSVYKDWSVWLNKALKENNLTQEDFMAWYYGSFKPWLKNARESGTGSLVPLKNSPVGKLVFATGNLAKVGTLESIEVTGEAINELANQVGKLAEGINK